MPVSRRLVWFRRSLWTLRLNIWKSQVGTQPPPRHCPFASAVEFGSTKGGTASLGKAEIQETKKRVEDFPSVLVRIPGFPRCWAACVLRRLCTCPDVAILEAIIIDSWGNWIVKEPKQWPLGMHFYLTWGNSAGLLNNNIVSSCLNQLILTHHDSPIDIKLWIYKRLNKTNRWCSLSHLGFWSRMMSGLYSDLVVEPHAWNMVWNQ